MIDLIYDVISYSASRFAIGKLNSWDELVIKTRKSEKMDIKEKFITRIFT